MMKYLVISPVKDEARNIERCIDSVIRQTVPPVRWVIVDDGSQDRTVEIVQRYGDSNPFITLIRTSRGSERGTGIREVVAFNAGYETARDLDFDFVVKLDGDVSFQPDYFERLLSKFAESPRLGIASGIYEENRGREWKVIQMPEYHAVGASKVVRRTCFEAIGGFVAERGWDSVDEIRAMALGWETRNFPEIRMRHWRPEGSGMGYLNTCYMHGEIYYRTGGGTLFFLLKVLKRLIDRPFIAGATALAWGYLHHAIRRTTLLVSQDEAELYRSLLLRRLFGRVSIPPAS